MNVVRIEYWLNVKTPGKAYATAKVSGQAIDIPLSAYEIGPFGSIVDVSDYVSNYGSIDNSYSIIQRETHISATGQPAEIKLV